MDNRIVRGEAFELALRRLEEGPEVAIAGLGDSLTQGWMVSRGFFDRAVDVLADRCRSCAVRGINAGVPGDTAAGGLARVDRLLARAPHVVVIQFALNDLWCGVPVDRFRSTIAGIARRVEEAEAAAVLATSCPLPDPSSQARAAEYFEAVRAVGRAGGLPVADMDEAWRANARLDSMRTDDGVHPDEAGHALMARALVAVFSR